MHRKRSFGCVISQRYWKMKAIHNTENNSESKSSVVLYLKDTEKWKQFTTLIVLQTIRHVLCYISKILKNESNSQQLWKKQKTKKRCVISQRYWKMKAIHNWSKRGKGGTRLCYISKILKNESNSQLFSSILYIAKSCVISQRYWKMKAIHNTWHK